MVKIINNQNSIKSFSLRFMDLNNVVVKTITEAEYPISKESTSLALNSDIDTDMEVMIPYSNTAAKALEGNVQSKLNATKLLEIQTALLEMGGLAN